MLLWAAGSVVLAVWYAGRIRDWAVMTDELQYAKLATAIGGSGSPLPSIHDTAVSISNQLYPLLIAPFYGALSAPSAFRAAHILNAVVMTSAAIPAYLLGRQVVSRPWAFAVAALSIAGLWMVLTGFVMSEPAAYPAFLWALVALQLAIASPTLRHDALAAGALGLAFLARAQFAVLVLVLPLAILGYELGRALSSGDAPWWRRVARSVRTAIADHALLAAMYAVGAVVALSAAASDSVGGLLGSYSVTLEEGSLLPAETWSSAVRHLDTLAIGAGLVPLVLGGGWMLAALYRSRSDAERSLATLSLATVVLLTVETASYNVRFGGAEVIRERYLFYLVPLFLVGSAAALAGPARRPLAIAMVCITVLFAATARLLDFEPVAGLSVDSPATVLNDVLGDLSGDLGTGTFVAMTGLVMGAALVVGVLFAPRVPLALAIFALLAVFSAYGLRTAGDRVLRSEGPSGRPLAEPPGIVLDWIDSVVPDDADVALVPFPVSTDWNLSSIRWWDAEFWNSSVTRTYVAPDGAFTYTPFPTRALEIDWETGEIAGTDDAPEFVVRAPGDPRFGIRGTSRAANVGLEVVAAELPYRAVVGQPRARSGRVDAPRAARHVPSLRRRGRGRRGRRARVGGAGACGRPGDPPNRGGGRGARRPALRRCGYQRADPALRPGPLDGRRHHHRLEQRRRPGRARRARGRRQPPGGRRDHERGRQADRRGLRRCAAQLIPDLDVDHLAGELDRLDECNVSGRYRTEHAWKARALRFATGAGEAHPRRRRAPASAAMARGREPARAWCERRRTAGAPRRRSLRRGSSESGGDRRSLGADRS